ncbi:hypothetical protein L1987_30375 [Smallanthus sonchifolius]|uniref:Uncharacterized protein n=1 Tax=Smallanthus sonchifolius TaxID=185202 RepID=A0ACB9I2M6_9ASTR|nr:hypothetical protein L1987_30375 [Smallanthus sonchifolius]
MVINLGHLRKKKMVMWVFGYGSLIWKAGFHYGDRLVGFIKDYRRVFYQGSTDHKGTPEYPGRTVTLESAEGEVCWGVAYKVSRKEDQEVALTYLEVREKQYDKKVYVDFFTKEMASSPAVTGVMVYIASPDKANINYLGPASVEEIAKEPEPAGEDDIHRRGFFWLWGWGRMDSMDMMVKERTATVAAMVVVD